MAISQARVQDERFSRIEGVGESSSIGFDFLQITGSFPKQEMFGMTSQIRRCSSSIPANIAEGCGRMGNTELHRFLQIACGSANELEYHFLLAKDLGYLPPADYASVHKQLLEMKRMLVALAQKVASERRV